jgi:hypothetical protein
MQSDLGDVHALGENVSIPAHAVVNCNDVLAA